MTEPLPLLTRSPGRPMLHDDPNDQEQQAGGDGKRHAASTKVLAQSDVARRQ